MSNQPWCHVKGMSCLIGAIRELCYEGQANLPLGVSYQYCDDQKYATIDVSGCRVAALCLWVSWYKTRGRTDAMWLLGEYGDPRQPTAEELKKVVEFYRDRMVVDLVR